MNTRIKSSFLILFATITVFFVMAVFLRTEQETPSSPVVYDTPKNVEQPPAKKSEYIFLAKTYEGNIALFSPDNQVRPIRISDINVASLPAADIALLETGIEIFTQEQLSQLLEDYGS